MEQMGSWLGLVELSHRQNSKIPKLDLAITWKFIYLHFHSARPLVINIEREEEEEKSKCVRQGGFGRRGECM